MMAKETFDEYGKRRLKELIERGQKPTIIAGFTDGFGDSSITQCSACNSRVFIRPWLLEAVLKHNWKVICLHCADPQDVIDQVRMDFTRLFGDKTKKR